MSWVRVPSDTLTKASVSLPYWLRDAFLFTLNRFELTFDQERDAGSQGCSASRDFHDAQGLGG